MLSLSLAGWAQEDTATPPGSATLGEVQVSGDRAGAAAAPARRAQSSSRLGLTLLETPRAISVVDRELMDQQAPTNEKDVLRNAAGVSTRSEYYGSYSQFTIRGLWANNTFNYLRDGAKFMHMIDPPLFNIESVEVIKGPAALEFGQVAPGGLINYVSKKPLAEPLRTVRVGAGSHGWVTGEFDLTGPLNADQTLLYRLNGAASRGGSATDGVTPQKKGLGASIEWRLTPQTRWRTQLESHHFDSVSNTGLPVPVATDVHSADAVRGSNFYGEPWLTSKGHLRFYSSELTHRFNDAVDARLYLSRNETVRHINILNTLGPVANGRVARGYWLAPNQKYISDTMLAELRAQVQTGGVRHRLLAGMDWRAMAGHYGARTLGSLPSVDLYNPVVGKAPAVASTGISVLSSDARNPGFFVQDQMQFGPWQLTAGLRHDRIKDTYAKPLLDQGKTQPSFALSYQPTASTMLYASHARSFQANSGTLLVGNRAAPPSEGKQLEVGVKQEWLNQRLMTTVAVFDLELSNAPSNDPANPGFSVLTGRQRIKGLELEAKGRLAPGWTVTAQASFMDPKVVVDTAPGVNVGNRVASATKRTASLWTQYQVAALPGLWLGGGFAMQGDKMLANNNQWRLPGYTVLDLALGYQFRGGPRLQANLKNATNKRYYIDGNTNAKGFTSVTAADPRALQISLDYAF